MAKACTTRRVVIRKKHGRKLKSPITFTAHKGTGCPKPRRSTGHLKEYKQIFRIEAKACAKRQGKNWNRKTYAHCIGQGMKTAFKNR
jgi:hypothetical protein